MAPASRIASAIASATRHHPSYLSRCTAAPRRFLQPHGAPDPAEARRPAGADPARRGRRRRAGRSGRRAARPPRRQRERQSAQTSASPSRAGTGASHRRHAAGQQPALQLGQRRRASRRAAQRSAASTAARMISVGGVDARGTSAEAPPAPWATSMPRPSAARQPGGAHGADPGRFAACGTPCRTPPLACGASPGSSGSGSSARRPSGVALITSRHSSARPARCRAPRSSARTRAARVRPIGRTPRPARRIGRRRPPRLGRLRRFRRSATAPGGGSSGSSAAQQPFDVGVAARTTSRPRPRTRCRRRPLRPRPAAGRPRARRLPCGEW